MKAIREMVKQYASIEDEDKYRESCIKMIENTFDLTYIEAEALMYIAEGDWYVYPWDRVDFTLTRHEDKSIVQKIKARVYQPWKCYNIIYELDANLFIRDILRTLSEIDLEYKNK